MKKISKTFLGLFCMTLLTKVCLAQTTPIDAVAPGPHIFFETRNFVVTNSADPMVGPTLKFDLYMSASQTYVDYLLANDPDHNDFGFQAGDVAFDLDFGSDGSTVYTMPNGWQAVKTSNQLSDIQAPQSLLAGNLPAGYDTRFKFTPYRLPASDPLTTTPTHVATATMTWPAGVVIGTAAGGAKIQLRCAATGFGTGLSGSKWGDMSGHIQNVIGPSAALSTPLPVKLVGFSAAREGNTTTLAWSTSEETNSDYFDVQRSGDGKAWEKLKTVAAKGESSVEAHYSAVDDNPMSGNNFYRLKMVDKDGTFAFSKIRVVEFDLKTGYTLFPNPVSDKLNLKSTEDWNSVASIKIYNAQGVEVYTSPSVPAKEVDVKNLPSGTYVVKLSRKSRQSQSYKVVIAH